MISPRPARLWASLAIFALVFGACQGTASPSPAASSVPASLLASASPPASAPAASASGPTGTLTVGLSAEAESMDPYLVYQTSGFAIMHAIFDTLVAISPDGQLGPDLADSWTNVNDTTIEFKLHSGVKFQNGDQLDANAVKFSIYRVADIDPATDKPITDDSKKLNSGFKSNFGSVATVEVVDPLTVRVHLSRPDAGLVANFGTLEIVSPSYWQQVGNAGFASKPIGTGPFKLDEWVKDDHSTLEANPDYWNNPAGRPLVAKLVFRPIPDASTRVSELDSGGVQIIQDVPADQADTIKAAGANVVYKPDAHHFEIWLNGDGGGNLAKNPGDQKTAIEALQKKAVRYALNLAVDRQTIIQTLLHGFGEPMSSLWVTGDKGFDPTVPAYPFDQAAARKMLSDAGYKNGFNVNLDFCTCDNQAAVEAVVADLAKVGVNATIKPAELSQFNNAWGAGDTNPMRSARLGFPVDPNTYLYLWLRGGGFLSRYKNPQLDALIDQQAGTYDLAKRTDLLRQMAPLTHDDPPAIWLWGAGSLYGVGKGVTWTPSIVGYIPVVNTSVSQ